MQIKNRIILILFSVIILFGCVRAELIKTTNQKELLNDLSSDLLISPSGKYKFVLQEFDNNGIKSYTLRIIKNDNKDLTELDIIFRARDNNYVCWADNDDILWCYSGDIGSYYWIYDNNMWNKKSYAEDKNVKVPKLLLDLRPDAFK